jgi:hypothetical protein
MRKFITRSLCFICILSIAAALLSLQKRDHKEVSDYMAAIEDKHKLLEDTRSPKIILI